MEPFQIDLPSAALEDLWDRLDRTRWPDEADDAGWRYGTDLSYLRGLVRYWRDDFDWRSVEARLNAVPQFRTEIDGLQVHFAHVRSPNPDAVPLIFSHGWPGTFAEFLPLVPRLSDAFHLVIPSLPGFIFSAPYTRPGPRRIHDVWAALMQRLGYARFGACGSDVGARVTSRLGWYHRDRVIGIHISSVDLEWPNPLPDDLSEDERAYVARCNAWEDTEGGYAAIQSTRPQTLGYGLTDSPVGLAAWIVEKYRAWGDCHGDIATRFTADELLTTISLYWFTNTINSANRHYFEARHDAAPLRLPPGTRIEAPAGIAMFPGEADLLVPRTFAERCYNIVRWTDPPQGGHFPGLEEPALLADDIRAFFDSLQAS
ncbi:epoxide hydrolase family protein [Catellatospora aurea]|uniref:Epoxide hydrolase family protein n=1 Tax=Catellatospora aurea TaxID=1337874 RepID=A0ABW2H8W1_9ACTN